MTTLFLSQASRLPAEIDIDGIADEAIDAAYAVIAKRLAGYGYPVTGDIAPEELLQVMEIGRTFARSMALNNPQILALNEER